MASRILSGLSPILSDIRTLDPSKLIPSDFVDLSGLSPVTYNARLADNSRLRTANALYYAHSKGEDARFPTDTRGFLYFHAPSREVRFRLASNDPRHFAEGTDLVLPSGEPWCLPAVVLATQARAYGLRALLVQDGVRMDALALSPPAAQRTPGQCRKYYPRGVTRLGETFPVYFALQRMTVAVGTPGTLTTWQSPFKWSVQRQDSGQALIAFERSLLPAHRGRRVLVLRVHRILGKPQLRPERKALWNHHLYMPKEGNLVYIKKRGGPGPWSYDIDVQSRWRSNRIREVFRELWEHDDVS
ncbi:hypothetical protein FA95DRAFT_1562748 [Auriscalpium vulgare]|uniref:Uncharacterized protein n=1 Tax=Auriscalpium vulgare TaxID=40419 RepID=A0ACB8RIP4_9AGAM|nr:hypothetical protein FA95DRAFT_1562748 [Auriscalpium vulgare]